MSLKFLITGQGCFLLLLVCLVLAACNKNAISEPDPLIDKNIYLNEHSDRQYPPEEVMQVIKSQLEEKNSQKYYLKEARFSDHVFHQFKLKNGLLVDFLSRDDSPHINIMAIVNAGKDQINEKDELLSPLILKLLKQGTQKYSKSDFQQTVSLLGEPLRYWQTSQYSVVSMNILPQDLDLALSLLVQQVAYIEPDKNAYRTIIEQQLIENKLAYSSGSYLAKLLFYRNNYPVDHIYYQSVSNNNKIKNFNKAEILNFYEKFYRPARTRLIISGDVDAKILQNKIIRYFSNWHAGLKKQSNDDTALPLLDTTSFSNNQQSQFDFIERKGAQQIDLLYGVVTIPRRSSDWLNLNIIAALLGGGPSSRLFSDLREKQGLAYFISARQLPGRYQSPFFIQTAIAPDKLIQTINTIHNHIEHLCHNEVNKQELAQIKQQLIGEIMFKLQTNQQLANNKMYQFENDLSSDYLYQLSKSISRITAQQLLNTANKYLCGQHNFIAVGELNAIEKTIREKFKGYRFRTHHLPLH